MSVQAALCATLVDEWVRHGVRHAVIAPGSRSTPLAVALACRADLDVHVVLDERSAAFVALGIARATRRPAALLCTSGTAAVGFHAAVVEAGLSGIPMLVCTADRPPDLHGVGAPQAIDQVGLYGVSPVWSADVDPLAWPPSAWRSLGSRAAVEAAAGPVHLNLRFREPLLEDADEAAVPSGRAGGRPWHQQVDAAGVFDASSIERAGLQGRRRVLVVAGEGCEWTDAEEVAGGSWPVFADPQSSWRVPGPATIAAFDAIVRSAPGDADLGPDLVLHVGRPPASKALGQWLHGIDAAHVLVHAGGSWLDASRRADAAVRGRPALSLRRLRQYLAVVEEGWRDRWQHAEAVAQGAIAEVLADHPEVTEPGLARDLVRHLPRGAALVASSSMPVRDVEWFAEPRTGVEVHANRGANGIDGVTSTALGVALARGGDATAVLLGDLAFLHDAAGLNGIGARPCNLTVVVIDNQGGGIFSFLPQAAQLPPDRFELLFGTPQPVDLHALTAAHGLPSTDIETAGALAPALEQAMEEGGVRVLVARTDRRRNVAVHAELADAVGEALARR